jgi:hypothetical protein
MPAKRKLYFSITALGIALILLLAIMTACDNRRAVDPKLNIVPFVTMSLSPNDLIIHSLENSDTIAISVRVRDADGNGIDSVEVDLTRTPATGTIVPPVLTDSGGYASALFVTDPGIDHDMDVVFTATSGSGEDTDTLHLLVSLQGEIDTMYISLGKTSLVADGQDSTRIYVSVIDTTGVPISDGTVIALEKFGAGISGTIDSTFKKTINGIATFKLTAPPQVDTLVIIDTENLVAWGVSLSGDTSFAISSINYVPDDPAVLSIPTIPVAMVAGSGETQNFLVRVSDAHGSFVLDGTQVRFRNNLATSDITSLTTTTGGYATGIYTVGTEAELDQIQAFYTEPGTTDTLFSNIIPIPIRSSEPTNIALSTTDANIEIGGIATIIHATMQDENSNPLSDGFLIRFEITAAPNMGTESGPSFRYVPTTDSVLLETEQVTNVNGRASVALFSGTRAGTVRIKATSVDNENIFKEKPLITIQSGPPAIIEIGPSNIATADGEAIVTGITAQVWDQYTNPVEPQTAVYFSVIPDTIAYIEGYAVTGGYVVPPDTVDTIGTRGLAQTWMSYTCYHTFDTVRVVASSGPMADTSEAIVLAIYAGALSVDVNPGVLYCSASQPTQYSDVAALLQDGLGCPIENGIIMFSNSGCGQISGPTQDTSNSAGYTETVFRIRMAEIPTDPPPPGCNAKVKARLRGNPDVEGEADIYCTISTD